MKYMDYDAETLFSVGRRFLGSAEISGAFIQIRQRAFVV